MKCPKCYQPVPYWRKAIPFLRNEYCCRHCGTDLVVKNNYIALSIYMFLILLLGIVGIIAVSFGSWLVVITAICGIMIMFIISFHSRRLIVKPSAINKKNYGLIIYLLTIFLIVISTKMDITKGIVDRGMYLCSNLFIESIVNFNGVNLKIPVCYLRSISSLGALNLYTFSSNELIIIRTIEKPQSYQKMLSRLGYNPVNSDCIDLQKEKLSLVWALEKDDPSRCIAIVYMPKNNIEISFFGEKDRLNSFKRFVRRIT